jgi:hypothetical protein
MPPNMNVDRYKDVWDLKFTNMDQNAILQFGEHKGAARVSFRGSSEASRLALELVNLVCGREFLHTYGCVAGVCA